jgi:flagellar protein FliS
MNPKDNKAKGADAYRRADVMTANRETILLMMYSGAIRALKKAIESLEKNQRLEKAKQINKTQEIVNELRSTLNFSVSPEIAQNLDSLYDFITQRLITGNLANDAKPLNEALNVLVTLNGAWEEAIASLKKEKTQAAAG